MTDQDQTQAHEAPEAATTSPVGPVMTPPRTGRGRLRWIVALVVTALVVASAAGATLLFTASTGQSEVLAWAPADTVSYLELRLDLPGSQRAEVTKLLAAFPGFADQAAFPAKMGEALDRLVKAASNGKHDYQAGIAPWFGGQLAVAAGPMPTPAAGASPTALAGSIRALVLAQVTDAAKATAWINAGLGEIGTTTVTTTTETYGGVQITRVHEAGSGASATTVPDMGYAIVGHVLAAGDLTSLKAAIDTKGTTGLASTAAFKAASSAVAGDRVAFYWTDLKASFTQGLASITAMSNDPALDAVIASLADLVPAWSAGTVRAVDGNLVLDGVQPHSTASSATNRASDLAALAPASTIALIDTHDVGKALAAFHARLAAQPKLADALKQVDSALSILGGFDATTGWLGDTGIVITRSGDSVSGGLIVKPADAASAKRLFTSLRGMIEIGASGAGVAFRDETYGDATITTVDLSGLGPLLSAAAGGAGLPAPTDPGSAVPSSLKLVYSVTDQVVVLGADPTFVKAVLDARTGDSLAKNARFSALVGKAAAQNARLAWLDVAAIRDLVEKALPADARTKYEADVKPYLLPLDAIVSTSSIGNDFDRSTMILSITH